jgi:hypothetical protein
MLEAQNVSVRIKQTLLDANLTLNLRQGQAQSEGGDNDIHTVIYQDEEAPLTSTSKPTGSKTPPSPPSAPLPPPSCPPPLPKFSNNAYFVNCKKSNQVST